MPDDTTAALQALMQQVTKLTETVTAQQKRMDDLYAHNGRLLDKVMDAKREKEAPAPKPKSIVDIVAEETQERKMRASGLDKDADGNWYPKGIRPKHAITREDARDPRKYAAAKEAAAKDGATVTVIDGDVDPTIRNTGKRDVIQSKTFTFDDDHERVRWVRADMQTGKGIVQRRMQAEQEGYTIKTFHSLDDLPQHARTKFELMERAANAES